MVVPFSTIVFSCVEIIFLLSSTSNVSYVYEGNKFPCQSQQGGKPTLILLSKMALNFIIASLTSFRFFSTTFLYELFTIILLISIICAVLFSTPNYFNSCAGRKFRKSIIFVANQALCYSFCFLAIMIPSKSLKIVFIIP